MEPLLYNNLHSVIGISAEAFQQVESVMVKKVLRKKEILLSEGTVYGYILHDDLCTEMVIR